MPITRVTHGPSSWRWHVAQAVSQTGRQRPDPSSLNCIHRQNRPLPIIRHDKKLRPVCAHLHPLGVFQRLPALARQPIPRRHKPRRRILEKRRRSGVADDPDPPAACVMGQPRNIQLPVRNALRRKPRLRRQRMGRHDPAKVGREVLERYAAVLRSRPTTLELLAWECSERPPLMAILEDTRQQFSNDLVAELGQSGLDFDPRIWAAADIIAGAINYFAVRGRHIRWFASLDIGTDEGWAALFDSVEMLFQALSPTES